MTSPAIKVLILTAAAAVIYLFVMEIRRSRRAARLIAWVQENHPAAWGALPWTARKIHRLGALYQLHRAKAIADPHFEAELKATKPLRREEWPALAVAVGAFALLALGLELGWWRW
ncbi:hypothetical protein [Pelagibius marinus]|uniref:hypothetical protein n=1 Tax=Pelagibius marinus TaxID=2762760 RepID=UPI0018730819|nr:hypothetical protein [Pelagibius marinus]